MKTPPLLRRRLAQGLLAAWLGALGLTLGPLATPAHSIEVGSPFPDLALRTLGGEVRQVSDYRGQKLILHVFASW